MCNYLLFSFDVFLAHLVLVFSYFLVSACEGIARRDPDDDEKYDQLWDMADAYNKFLNYCETRWGREEFLDFSVYEVPL